MIRLCTSLFFLLIAPLLSHAANLTLAWTGHINATHYRIYRSVDGGVTWSQDDPDIAQPVPFPASAEVTAMIQGVPEDKLVLFRASALRNTSELITHHQGAWYDHRLRPPTASQLGAK